MKQALKKVASVVLPRRAGNAGCPPDPYTDYWCQKPYYYKRTCRTPANCGPDTCGPWVYFTSC